MPLSSGLSIHDDTKHKGSAKRDAVGGVAALDVGGNLLVAGYALSLVRTGSGNIVLMERTSGETMQYWHRVGGDDYTSSLKVGGVDKLVQHAGDKDVANGIAGLDAGAKLSPSAFPLYSLTEVLFKENAATGTSSYPTRLNDGSTFDSDEFNAIGEYGEILFDHPSYVREFRQYGAGGNNGDGTFKIQYLYEGSWIDNTLGINTRSSESWSNWAPLDIPVYVTGVRWVATGLDTQQNNNFIRELSMRG